MQQRHPVAVRGQDEDGGLQDRRDHLGSIAGAGRLLQWITVEWQFDGEVIEWRGPAPFFFVAMSEADSAELKEEARSLIYWGQVPVQVVIGDTEFRTALFPREGRYLVPLKDAVRTAEDIHEGDVVTVLLRPARRE